MPASPARVTGTVATVFTAIACLLVLSGGSTSAAPQAELAGAADAAPSIEFNVIESDQLHTVVEILVPDFVSWKVASGERTFDVVGVPGGSPFGEPGEPLLQVAATLIAVPPTAGVQMRVLEEEFGTWSGYELPPVPDPNAEPGAAVLVNEEAYARDAFLPASAVRTDDPAIMRDYRVVPLRVHPVRYNAVTDEIRVLKRAVVEFEYGVGEAVNALTSRRPGTRAFRPIYENAIANYDHVKTRYESDGSGKYVIITHDNYYSTILPLAEWKHKRGMEVEIAKLSVIGSSSSAIKTYIQNAYNTWSAPPEFVLLVGDTEQTPTGSEGDDYYAKLSGSDYLVDVDLGRFSCDSVADCELLVAKTLGYKRDPDMSDPDWFRSACLMVRDDYDSSDATYYEDTWHAYDLMIAGGFVHVDTLFRKNGDDYNDTHAAVTDGRAFVNYRGQGVSNWWSPFDCNPNSTSPNYKLPVVMSATCGTGSYWSDGYPCETWMRAGTVANPKGSVGFVATYEIVSHGAHLRSCVNQNFYSAIFNLRLYTLSTALNNGKLAVFQLYGDQDEYEGWNTQGDPELDVWTMTPQTLTVTHPASVPTGSSNLVVEVEQGGNPVSKVLVCAYVPGEVYASGLTDLSGIATLPINPSTADTVWITVTGHNLYPYEGHAEIVPSGSYLEYGSHAIDDATSGNGDGLVNPGETILLTVGILNSGPETAVGVTGVLEEIDAYVALVDSTDTYGAIASSATVTNPDPFEFHVSDACPNDHGIGLTVAATDAARPTWTVLVPNITVAAAELAYSGAAIGDGAPWGDGDGVLESGETAWVTITLDNDGPVGLDEVAGSLTTSDAYVAVTDADGYFGTIAASGSASSSANSFRVSVSPGAPPGHEASLVLSASGDGGTYTHAQDVGLTLTLGGAATAGPSGPDTYGYYAYDHTDVATGQAPTYSWVELVGVGTKIAAITDEDAQVAVISLPFTFQYYGSSYSQITACSNGFLAMGNEDYRLGDNSSIPNTHGPDAMIAPFWDDLDPSDAGDVYEWYDSANHRYIIQFDACVHYGGANPETFEVILYDPVYYPTTSGDGIIVYQYEDAAFVYSMTMGIENPAQNDGIQYVYNSTYDANAAPVADGLAVKFTTEPPDAPDIWLVVDDMTVDDSATGNDDGLAQPLETLDLIVTLENRLSATAPSVSATLTTTDPDVTIDDGTASFGSIPGSGTGDNSASPFVLTIAGLPSDDTVELDITISTGSRYDTWDVVTLVLDLSQTGIEEGELPLAFALRQNYPNPFRSGTTIAFGLPAPSDVRIDVYNVAGRKVATVLNDEMPTGWHAATWDGRDSAGNDVSAGMYFYRIEAGSRAASRKMILVR
ncbi:MAG: C25 family cysteine peptidase [Candidatus Eisenbacteria bacterium]